MKKITLLIITLLLSFTSFSQLQPPPGIEGFENTAGPDLASPTTPSPWNIGTGEWQVFDNGVGLTRRWGISTVVDNVYQGLNAAYMDREFIGQGNTSEDYLATPLVTVPANGQLRFYTRSTIAQETATLFQIKIAPVTGSQLNPSDYTLVQQWTEATLTTTYNVYEQKIVNLSSYAGQQVYIAFVMKYTQNVPGLSGDRWLVDNVQLVENCLNPANLNVNPVTFNGGSLTWTSQGSTSWEVEILPVGQTPTGIGTIYNGTLPYIVNNLLPNTNYQFLVRSVCSPGVTSAWVGPYNFTTTTAPPICGGNFVDVAGPTTNYADNSDSTVTICPINSGDVVTVTFTEFSTEAQVDGLYVYNGNSTTTSPQFSSANDGGFVPGGLPGSYWGNTIPGPFTSSATNGCLTFRFRSDGFFNLAGWIANISCAPAPTCAAPYSLTTNTATSTTVNLAWTNPNSATTWHVIALPCTATPPNNNTTGFTVANSNPFTLTGLNPDTCYNVYVRAVCSITDLSNWSAPSTFNTQIAPPVCGGIYTDPSGANANYLNGTDSTVTICPINTGDVVTVTFTEFNTETNWDGLYVFNGNSINSPQISSGNPAANVPGGLAGSFWGNTVPEPFTSTATNGCLTFRFRSDLSVNFAGWVANVTCGLPPTCPRPNTLLSSNITSTTATVQWTNPNNATSWNIIALPCNSPAPNETTTGFTVINTNPYTLTGLTADTCYDVYVRAVCTGNDLSLWSNDISFNTQVTPPACGGFFTDLGGSFSNYLDNTDSTITICPINSGDVVTVTFTEFSTEAQIDGLYVYNGDNTTTAPQFSSANNGGFVPGGLPGSYWGNAIPGPFTSSAANGCLTFRFISDGFGNLSGWIANVSCAIAPTCPAPYNLSTNTATATTVNVAWVNPNTATLWHVIALPCTAPPPTNNTTGFTVATTNPFTLTGLNADTCYNIYVRAVCSTTDLSNWSAPSSFNTQVTPPACGGVFTDPAGANANYLNFTDSTVTICPIIAGQQVTVEFTSFNTEQNWDGLYVYNGNAITSPQISSTNPGANVPGGLPGSYWGNTIPGPFTGDSPSGCLTFRFRSDGSVNFAGWVANVICLPPPTCPRPTLVTVTNPTQTGATIGWTEIGPATTWEVLILTAGSPIPTATTTGWISTTNNPYVATGLNSATQYVVYVRSHCSDSDISFWSTPGVVFATLITNDECLSAVVVPVNADASCAQTVAGSLIGATASGPTTTCFGNPDDDVWFQFTAVTSNHYVALNNITGGFGFDLVYEIFSGTCGTLTPIICNTNTQTTLSNLTPGQVYYIRIFSFDAGSQPITFNVCVGTIPPPISTNETQFTNVQLIEDILLDTTCASVTSITSSTGTNFGSTNGIGYFNRNGSTFPFEEGIVLTTGNAINAPGPNSTTLGEGSQAWVGDTDLEAIILAATGQVMNSRNASKLEFDFVPLTNNISFNFIFASEEYGTFQCIFSDAFAFLLTDIATGITTNLAVLPSSTTPISVVTIRDALYNNGCASVNPEYFDEYYLLPQGVSPLGASINFNGVTVPLTASSPVVAGNQYHIKMVIADRGDTAFDSAVFLEGGSLNIGNIELGGDFLQSDGTALCNGESYTITSDLSPTLYTFAWTLNGTTVPNETGPNLAINAPGVYALTANYTNTTCASTDSVTIEYYDAIIPATPNNLVACNNLGYAQFTLSQNTSSALGNLNPATHTVSYYLTSNDANLGTNVLPNTYTNTTQYLQTIYVRVANSGGCYGVTQFNLVVQDLTPQFTITPNFTVCPNGSGQIIVTPSNFNSQDVTYSWTLNGNSLPNTTSSINVSLQGTYVVTVNNSGCTNTGSTTLTITPLPTPDDPADVVSCGTYILPTLSNGNYFSQTNGSGTAYFAGDSILSSTTLFVYSQSNTTPNCTAENSFTVTINTQVVPTFTTIGTLCQNAVAPILPTISNNGINGTWNAAVDTSTIGTTTYIFTPNTGECASSKTIDITITAPIVANFNQISAICQNNVPPTLPATSTNGVIGTWNPTSISTLNAGTTIYTFTPNSGQCASGTTMNITINTTPVLTTILDVDACTSYVLPTLNLGNYYSQPNGQGASIPSGTILTTSQTLYVFAQSNTIPNCSDEESFTVTITNLPQFAINGGCQGSNFVLEASPINNSFLPNDVSYSWTNSTGLIVGNSQVITVTSIGNYTCTITINSTGCVKSEMFTANDVTCSIPKGISPNGDALNDSFDLSGLNVTNLSIFNRYGTKVYTKGNYTKEWFGQADNGNELPDGTYFYVIETATTESRSGWVYINREN